MIRNIVVTMHMNVTDTLFKRLIRVSNALTGNAKKVLKYSINRSSVASKSS